MLKPALQDYAARAVQTLAEETASGPAMIVGAPWCDRGKLYNAMLLLQGGRIVTARYKHDLPNYGVFDEKRVFAAGPIPGPMAFPLPGAESDPLCASAAWSARTCGPRTSPRACRNSAPRS